MWKPSGTDEPQPSAAEDGSQRHLHLLDHFSQRDRRTHAHFPAQLRPGAHHRDRAEALPLAGARAVRQGVEDDLDRRAEWIAAKRLPSGAETAFRCTNGIAPDGFEPSTSRL